MNHANSGLAHGTNGSPQTNVENLEIVEATIENELNVSELRSSIPFEGSSGHVTLESLSAGREFFLGKSDKEIQSELQKVGYNSKIKNSIHSTSIAKIIVITNTSRERNITQVQVSPGSRRHGDVPYVKVSTSDYGKIKIIDADPEQYKSDGAEKAILLFRRR